MQHPSSFVDSTSSKSRSIFDRNDSIDIDGYFGSDTFHESDRHIANFIANSMLQQERDHDDDDDNDKGLSTTVAMTDNHHHSDLISNDDEHHNGSHHSTDMIDSILLLSDSDHKLLDSLDGSSIRNSEIVKQSCSTTSTVVSSSPTNSSGTTTAALTQTTTTKGRSIPIPKHPNSYSSNGTKQVTSRASSQDSSGSGFLSSVFNQNAGYSTKQAQHTSMLLSHTPPSASGTSYENAHFAKRSRSGSVSGRLRSASEYLENLSNSSNQNNSNNNIPVSVLKDLIIMGDEELQNALDKYEEYGDPSALEEMIHSGALQNRLPQDLDLLGDLDLDFLTMDDVESAASTAGYVEQQQPQKPQHHPNRGSLAQSPQVVSSSHEITTKNAIPSSSTVANVSTTATSGGLSGSSNVRPAMPMQRPPLLATHEQILSKQKKWNVSLNNNANQHPFTDNIIESGLPAPVCSNAISKSLIGSNRNNDEYHDDGIGDLEFAGELVCDNGTDYIPRYDDDDNDEYRHESSQYTPSSSQRSHSIRLNHHRSNSPVTGSPASQSIISTDDLLFDDRRLRSNSLFSALINEGSNRLSSLNHRSKQSKHDDEVSVNTATIINQDFGSWMDPYASLSNVSDTGGALTDSKAVPVSSDEMKIDANDSIADNDSNNKSKKTTKKGLTRRASTGDINARLQEAERKKQEKKEQKELKKLEQKELKKQERLEKKLAKQLEKKQSKGAGTSSSKLTSSPRSSTPMDVEDDDSNEETNNEKYQHVSGSGLPRSLSDPNLRTSIDEETGLMNVERPDGWIGAYSPSSRRVRIDKFLAKRGNRVWIKTVKYDVRKNFADSRLRVKGRFVKKEDEVLMRELMSLT